MDGSADAIMCPACGRDFQPQEGAERCFCPHCGRPVDIAQARAPGELIRSAQEAARASQEAARRARQTLAEAEQNLAQLKETQVTGTTSTNEAKTVEADADTRAQENTETRQPQTSARVEARERQARTTSYRQDVCVRDQGSGQALFLVTLPDTWKPDEAYLRRFDNYSQPYRPFVSFTDDEGCLICLRMGDAGMQMSDGMRATVAMYGAQIAAQDRTNYADMPHPERLCDDHMREIMKSVASGGLALVHEWGSPDLAARQTEAASLFTESARRSFGTAPLKDPFAAELVRVYEFSYGGEMRRMAVYVRLYAMKDASGVDLMPIGMAASIGSAVGGLFGRKKGARGGKGSGSDRGASSVAWCAPDFDSYVRSGSIYWNVRGIATLTTPPELFEDRFEHVFMPFVRSFRIHPEMEELTYEAQRLYEAGVQNATAAAIGRMNAQTQAALEADRQRQAAFDARNAAWQAASDAHHAEFRSRTNSEFTYDGSASPDFSEAIRGINTYVTSDGREVEIDVAAERAYENQAGDVIGTTGSFDPGSDWSELPRT